MNPTDEIQATAAQLQKIRMLSDGELYQMACRFVDENGTIDSKKQVVSLVAHTQTWDDLIAFVNHQAGRDWESQRRYAGYKQFFQALKDYLNALPKKISTEWFPVNPEFTKKQRRNWKNYFAILVAREFLQHLEAENMYRAINR